MQNLNLLDERNDQLKGFFYSFFFWAVSFGVLSKFKHPEVTSHRSVDINNKIISILHGQFALWTSLYYISCSNGGYTQRNTDFSHFIIIISGGYFAYDTLTCILYNLYDFWMIYHHLLTLIAIGMSVQSKFSAAYIIVALIYFEVSNLPMHLRQIVKDCGLRHTLFYETLELGYFFLFILFRGALSPVLLFHVIKDNNTSILIKGLGSLMLIYGYYYIFEMGVILKRKSHQQKERRKKNINYYWLSINDEVKYLNYPKYEKNDPIL